VLAPPALGEQTPPWALVPISQLLENTDRLGATVFTEDSDGVCRRTPLVAGAGDVTFPSLALAAVLQYEKTSYIQSVGSRYRVGSKTFETVGGRLVLNWYGRGNQGGAFPYYPLSFVFRGIDIKEGAKPEPGELALKGGEFKDKIVFIGGTATALMDLKPTPFTHLAPYPGMEIHATAASNLLNGDYLRRIPLWVTALLVFFLGIAASVFFFRAKSAVTGALAPIALGVIYLGVAAFVFVRAYLWMDLAAPLSSILLSLIAAAVVSYASEGRARREIRRTFSSLVSPQIVNALMEDPSRWEFGGNEVEATVLFSDVKNFTTLSESCAPKELVTYLNDYFTKATHGILARDGAIDKYIGDAIMAEFGAVVPDPDHAKNACAAALELQRQDFKYGHDRPGGALDFITRVGINTGRMVVGLVGGHHRNFTAIGDSVNLASRLEGANKVYGTRIMVSESTANLVKDSFVIRELDYLTVKGKTKPIRIFELVGEKGQVPADRMAYVDAFHAALKLYHGRSFAEAKAAFQKLTSPEDPQLAAEEYIHRCETFIATPPPADWDGVYQLKSK
jgi:adenylate cyclase